MEGAALVAIIVGILLFALVGVALVFLRGGESQSTMRGLMQASSASPSTTRDPSRRKLYDEDDAEFDLEALKERTGHTTYKKAKEDINIKLFKAGFFTANDRKRFRRIRVVTPCVAIPLLTIGTQVFLGKPGLAGLAGLMGAFIGYAVPISWLERKTRAREEETLYFLPLVIEQISIGVSSSLDIGPCISEVVKMAEERDSHNPVTEMFVHTEKLMRSGLNLEESLLEVSEVNGQTEVKHAFMFLAQCAKHGGEISKQLQELADATMTQRQTYVEGRIAALPVKATGPLATVFAGFFALLFAGLMVRLMDAFGGGVGTTAG